MTPSLPKPCAFVVPSAGPFSAALPALAEQGVPGAHFVQNWDADGDGRVTAEEARARRADVFLSFGSDGNGFIVTEEYALFDEARAHDMARRNARPRGGLRRAADGMRLQANDADGEGRVSRAEFLENAASRVEGIDRNGDGVVTAADFGSGASGNP